jgi:AbrB family looped-hinge helix DNA binding protein
MTSRVTTNGQTVVPKKLRDRFQNKSGTALDWQADGDSIRVIKRTSPAKSKNSLEWLCPA